ncbi:MULTISPECIES: UDP-N-acetylglucosamine 1-carboxyvinyltransferase [Maricaulis]|jgi:UDP-N-acetylglucosamine 1-carboxyvinyltransferase|uniref:UDP-N-acetylglucosamine 1-carboxyvinyltransferase n=1 Tax=Maricaulis maris (strain MCS10) TaxID=394221 RepID=MURA_MARMM|nr:MULTISPECIES: UDP-N-acetylglucosamine 1-carboxyvinyltransferase [Maricaulis]Q0AQL8.1 RecName: Full=UDP-N-acetylglucosamine 1-carboxyvinyltransferase; AltName: Full=Enoylpyruvate transferase; AltName: Full=UDP-N-acetylglucosamine enolpyruvyl transferase; Short=EPT [Maricaulis maris MCS10]ABI65419.1 UDP-N-acetylglucosamine 1-carboxyvinyltransferase [Maricaulis maris MCS10]MAC89702.1 UDP-N-acetylglucosamine 1-carboxyvinyltransferase [Maricaulis sp.]
MDRIVIQGGARLEGRIEISGAKNSALKLMAAALLTDEPVILTRMPRLADSRFLGHLLEKLGVEVSDGQDAQLRLHAATIADTFAPYDLVRKMRASFNVLGPLLAREGHARVSLPGGCAIGARPVDLHLKALKALGAQIEISEGYVSAKAPAGGLVGGEIDLPFASVGATEHAMLAASLARGETVIENAAREPEIGDLADCLTAMGATIEGAGSSTIRIQGQSRLSGVTHKVVADRIETATYALAVAAAGGDAVLEGAVLAHNKALWSSMGEAGVTVEAVADGVRVARNGSRLDSVDIETQPFPGFPTDAQAQFMALMSLANGSSVIRETIFENRFMHAPELARLGADITVHGNEAVVRGVERLRGAPVMATDLRASVSLVIAGLAAEGETVVNRVYHLDRGFERLEAKLTGCGARIERLPDGA